MEQLNLFDIPSVADKWQVQNFSADNFGQQSARINLEQKLISITVVSNEFNRQSVSYQLSKNDCLHRCLKYKEGFSAQSVFNYDLSELKRLISEIEKLNIFGSYSKRTPYITITDGAYPDNTEKEIAFFTEWNEESNYSKSTKNLVTLCTLNSLEKVSYTAKDGQFLRWDYRSKKMCESAEHRAKFGKLPLVIRLDKGNLPTMKQSLLDELNSVFSDISFIQKNSQQTKSKLQFFEGNALYGLPKHDNNILDAVITSPPYCNRYDYTRTYALELAYLGITDEKIKKLRQELLSCTVENKPKIECIKENYEALGKKKRF